MNSTKREIEEYIKSEITNGALLIDGEWGSGKTYLLNEIKDNKEEYNDYHFVTTSLFSVTSIEALEKQIKLSMFIGTDTNSKKLVIARKIKETISNMVSESEKYSALGKFLAFDFLDLFTIENKVNISGKEKHTVLIFDDFERSKLDKNELLGLINTYCETKKIKVIIISNENEINNEDKKFYQKFKEKVVFRVIKIDNDYEDIIRKIIDINYRKNKNYNKFLNNNINTLYMVFKESKTNNLRILNSCMLDFERFFKLVDSDKKISISKDALSNMLYTFCVYKYEFISGNIENNNFNEIDKGQYFKHKKERSLESLKTWIVDGKWDEDIIINDLKNSHYINLSNSKEKILNSDLWSLDWETICKGIEEIINEAYEGKANGNEIEIFLGFLIEMKNYGFDIPKDIKFDQMYNSYLEREKIIIDKIEEEPEILSGLLEEYVASLGEDAVLLFNEVESFDSKKKYYVNRKKIMKAIEKANETDNDVFDFTSVFSLPIICFDEDMANMFINKYKNASNQIREVLTFSLANVNCKDSNVSREEDIIETKKSLESMILELSEIKSDNQMDLKMIDYTIDMINKLKDKATNTNTQDIDC